MKAILFVIDSITCDIQYINWGVLITELFSSDSLFFMFMYGL